MKAAHYSFADMSVSSDEENMITQLDGNCSISNEDQAKINKALYGVNCASNDVIQLITFFFIFFNSYSTSLNFPGLSILILFLFLKGNIGGKWYLTCAFAYLKQTFYHY